MTFPNNFEIFNMSFSSCVFPSVLKIAMIINVHKKDSKLYFSNYRPISLLSNSEKGQKGQSVIESINSSVITILSIP